MSTFKIGDRVKITYGCNTGREGVVVNLQDNCVTVDVYKDTHITYNLAYEFNELELIKMQEKKTKTVKKYAVAVEVESGADYLMKHHKTEEQVVEMNINKASFINVKSYHIVPTLFIEEEVPVETETRYTFICKSDIDSYLFTVDKYRDLETAKEYTFGMAIQQIDSSAEEFEIE